MEGIKGKIRRFCMMIIHKHIQFMIFQDNARVYDAYKSFPFHRILPYSYTLKVKEP
jgi:hypothetical protein